MSDNKKNWNTDNFRGKGTWKRKVQVDEKEFEENWNRIFCEKNNIIEKESPNLLSKIQGK